MTSATTLLTSIALPLLALIVVVVAGWFAVVRIRSWMKDDAAAGAAFSLEDLRRLKREGKLSDEEFDKAREMMIGSARKGPMPARLKPHVPVVPPISSDLRPSNATPTRVTPVRPAGLDATDRPSGDADARDDGTQPPRSPKRPPQLG